MPVKSFPVAPQGTSLIQQGDDYLRLVEQWVKDHGVEFGEGPLSQRPVIDAQNVGTGRRFFLVTASDGGRDLHVDVVSGWLVIPLPRPTGSALPESPYDGQPAYLRALGKDWLMRYRAAGGPTVNGQYCGWQFAGGPWTETRDDGAAVDGADRSITGTQPVLSLTAPRTGIWAAEYSARLNSSGQVAYGKVQLIRNGSGFNQAEIDESSADLTAQTGLSWRRPGRLAYIELFAGDQVRVNVTYANLASYPAAFSYNQRRLALHPEWVA